MVFSAVWRMRRTPAWAVVAAASATMVTRYCICCICVQGFEAASPCENDDPGRALPAKSNSAAIGVKEQRSEFMRITCCVHNQLGWGGRCPHRCFMHRRP